MISVPYMPAMALALLLVMFFGGRACGVASEREEWQQKAVAAELAQKKQDAKTDANNLKEVIRYVDRIQTVERVVPRVVTKLERVCDSTPVKPMPRPGEPSTAVASDPDAGQLDQLGAELIAARLNLEQCRALIAVVKPQTIGE